MPDIKINKTRMCSIFISIILLLSETSHSDPTVSITILKRNLYRL